jgi:dCMP deaminase
MNEFKFNENKWVPWFLGLADYVATASKDPSTTIGAVAIDQDKKPVSFGYNGFPSASDDKQEDYENREIKYKKVLHAEENIILNAKHLGDLKGSIVFITHPPCMNCLSRLSQVGVATIVCYYPSVEFQKRWNLEETMEYAHELDINLLFADERGMIYRNRH